MRSIVLFSALTLACAVTGAKADSGTKEEQAACRPDVRKFCSNLGKADEDQYKSCLNYNFASLSPKCQQVMTAHQNH